MQLKVLGCSGGIGGALRTTCLMLDDDILLDAGTGVMDLSIPQMLQIEHIFITHAHLDHIACIPLLADTVLGLGKSRITVHATVETWQVICDHLFNWKIWPDFTRIPSAESPILVWEEIRLGETVTLGTRKITPIPAHHVVPALGFHLEGKNASLMFSGDTSYCEDFWRYANTLANLQHMIVETSFPDAEKTLADSSRHFYPALLGKALRTLQPAQLPTVWVTHLKPGEDGLIMQEIMQVKPEQLEVHALSQGQVFNL